MLRTKLTLAIKHLVTAYLSFLYWVPHLLLHEIPCRTNKFIEHNAVPNNNAIFEPLNENMFGVVNNYKLCIIRFWGINRRY